MSDISFIGVLEISTQSNITALGTLTSLQVSGICTFASVYVSTLNSVDIGTEAGITNQNTNAIAIGNSTGSFTQGTGSIAIGLNAGQYSQGQNCIAIGNAAGQTNQGSGSIAIGLNAGSQQAANSMIINASANMITGESGDALFFSPIRFITYSNIIGYNVNTDELSYFLTPNGADVIFCYLIRFSSFSVPNGTNQALPFATIHNPNNVIGNIVSGGSTWTFNSTGIYQAILQIVSANTSAIRKCNIWINTTANIGTNKLVYQTGYMQDFALTAIGTFEVASTTETYSMYTSHDLTTALNYNEWRLGLIKLN
jgi:hypothetical protein